MRLLPVLLAMAIAILVAPIPGVLGSRGDDGPLFRRCVARCHIVDHCQRKPLAWTLRWTLWTCLDDCKYRCMHAMVDRVGESFSSSSFAALSPLNTTLSI